MSCPPPELLAGVLAGTASASVRGDVLDHAASCEECMAALAVLAPAAPGEPKGLQRLDRYELGRELGRGGMGVVYTARDTELRREVAIKILHPHASAARLRREAHALAKLSHPNVVRIYDVGEHDGQVFLAMELVDGDTLRSWLRTPRTTAEIVDVMLHAARGLTAAHQAGLVHRDFKPDNVFVRRDGQVLVGDFGLARSIGTAPSEDNAPIPATAIDTTEVDETLTRTGAFVGTPAYTAPEQYTGSEVTSAADQFAFCVTTWEALYGERPFAGDTILQIREAIRAERIREPSDRGVPARIAAALRRGLAADPHARFPSLTALVEAISPRTKRRWPWIAGAALIAATGTAAAFTLTRRSDAADCAASAHLIAPVWNPEVEARITADRDADLAAGFARYAGRWQDQRVDACRATHDRHEQTPDDLARRIACLDHAREILRITLDALADKTALPRTTHALDGLVALERCKTATGSVSPRPAIEIANLPLELELTLLDLAVRSGSGINANTMARASELRAQAQALGYGPTILAFELLDAKLAGWRGDTAAAEATLRRTIVEAEAQHDDFTRARAMATLANLIIDQRLEEATYLATGARAALSRAGDDSTVESDVLMAEVAVAREHRDIDHAAELQLRLIALYRDRYTTGGPLLDAYVDLAHVWTAGNRYDRAAEAQVQAREVLLHEFPGQDATQQLASENSTPAVVAGDFAGALLLEARRLVALRAIPHPLVVEAQVVAGYAQVEEIAGNFANAIARYREARVLWGRVRTAPPDGILEFSPTEIPALEIEARSGEAYNLFQLGRYDEAIAIARDVFAHAPDGNSRVDAELGPFRRTLARALVAKGAYREARGLLEPIVAGALPVPFPRGALRFALARCLWEDGGSRDREHAIALASDAAADFEEAMRVNANVPSMRIGLQRIRDEQTALAAWRKGHAIH